MRKFAILMILGLLFMGSVVAPVAAQNNCAANTANVLQNGTTGRVAQSYSSLRAGVGSPVILQTRYTGDTFTVTDEPQCSGAHWWISIQYTNGASGWATEGYGGVYWLEAVPADVQSAGDTGGVNNFIDSVSGVAYRASDTACPGAPAPRLVVGDGASVVQSYSSLRAGVHSNQVLRVIRTGQTVTVNAGPFCSTGPYNWYQVTDAAGTQGWVTEGTGANTYWLAPVQ